MQVMEVDSWDAHPGLLSAWNDLVAASAADSIFLTHEWLTSWWDAFRADRELKLIVCTEGDGEVVGVIPLYRTRVRTELRYPLELLRLVGDGTFDSDNLDVIARRGYEDRVVGALLFASRTRRSRVCDR